jgi:predicted AAA+ superfamily ATPase
LLRYYNEAMMKNTLEYRQDVAFINREKELRDLRFFVNKRPSEILFVHGPKSSGKTTLLYKSLEQIEIISARQINPIEINPYLV